MKQKDIRFVMEVLENALVLITALDNGKLEEDVYEDMSKALNILDQEIYTGETISASLRPLNFHDPDDMAEFDDEDPE